jgi:hypothetical protein
VFQSRSSAVLLSEACALEVADSEVGEAEDAQRIFWVVGLNVTLRFGRGTLRCMIVVEESVDRPLLGVVV